MGLKPININAAFSKVADVVKSIPPPPPPATIITKVEDVVKSIPKPAPKPSTNLPSAPVTAVAVGAAAGTDVSAGTAAAGTAAAGTAAAGTDVSAGTDQAAGSQTQQTVADQPPSPPAGTAASTPPTPTITDKINIYFTLINTTYPMWKKVIIYSGLAVCGFIILLIIGFLLYKLWKKFHPS